jgi:hypothetical protein
LQGIPLKLRDILFLDIILTGKTCPRQMGIRQIISSNIFDIIKFEMVITKVCFVNSCFLFADIVSPNRRKHPLQTISYKSAPSKEFVHCPRCRGQVNFLSFKHGALCLLFPAGFFASFGTIQIRPIRDTPAIRPSLQRGWTCRGVTPHFSAAS